MVSAISSAVSGLTAATQRLNISAQNIANAQATQTRRNGAVSNSPYVPQQLNQSTASDGSVKTSVQPVSQPSVPVYDPSNAAADADGITQYPNVDITQQLAQAQIASYNAQGNISVIKVQQSIFNQLLNIVS